MLGPAVDHYRCWDMYVVRTRRTRVCDTVDHYPNPLFLFEAPNELPLAFPRTPADLTPRLTELTLLADGLLIPTSGLARLRVLTDHSSTTLPRATTTCPHLPYLVGGTTPSATPPLTAVQIGRQWRR